MRKKTLRIIAIVTCFAIVSLSVPTVANAKDSTEKFSFRIFVMKHLKFFESLLPFLHMDQDTDQAQTQTKISKTNSDNNIPERVKKITGTVSSLKQPDDD